MSANARRGDFSFDCIVERPSLTPFGGRFAIVVALLLMAIALAGTLSTRRADLPQAGELEFVHAA